MISAMPNTPMTSGTKPMPSNRSLMSKVKRVLPVLTSVPTRPSSMPRKIMPSALMHRPARQHDGEHEAQRHQREIVRRRELLGELGQRRRGDGDGDGGDAAGEERADGGNGERRAGAALARHLVAVEAGDDRARLARQVDQDRRGRAAVLRAVVDAGQHDERALGGQEVGGRQQQRHRRHRADARQHADGGADDGAHQAPEQVLQRDRDREAERQIGRRASSSSMTAPRAGPWARSGSACPGRR